MDRITVIAQTFGTANSYEQKRLRLDATARVVRVMRLRRGDRGPTTYELLVLPLDHFPDLVRRREILMDLSDIAQAHGLPLGMATERARIVRASKDVAGHLGVPAATRVLKLDRVTKAAGGAAVEWRVAFIPLA